MPRRKITIEGDFSKAKNEIQNAENESATLRKEWELEAKKVERSADIETENKNKEQQNIVEKIRTIERKVNQSESSFYGWLNDHVPHWEESIGKVIDEESVLFNTELNPQLTKENRTSFLA